MERACVVCAVMLAVACGDPADEPATFSKLATTSSIQLESSDKLSGFGMAVASGDSDGEQGNSGRVEVFFSETSDAQ